MLAGPCPICSYSPVARSATACPKCGNVDFAAYEPHIVTCRCRDCGGSGRVRHETREHTPIGSQYGRVINSYRLECDRCKGSGTITFSCSGYYDVRESTHHVCPSLRS
jgi:hypothetical protein